MATAFSVWALIVLGGSVRVTDSGRGCADSWPMCNGHLLPALEYHQLVEWTHRLFAVLVGFLMMATVGSTLLWYRRPRRLLWLALIAGVTYLTQAILGGITVLLHLDRTWVAAHMGNSMILLASVVLLALFGMRSAEWGVRNNVSIHKETRRRGGLFRISGNPHSAFRVPHSAIKALAVATLFFTYTAMLTGSAVVGAEADLACPAWPQCADGHLFPANGAEWVNFGHRLAVGFSDVLMLALAVLIWRAYRQDRRLLRAAHALALLYVSQVFLGAFTIWLGAPEILKGAHLALAAATWAALVLLTALIWVQPNELEHPPEPPARGTKPLIQSSQPAIHNSYSTIPDSYSAIQNPKSTFAVYFGLIKPRVIPLLLVPTVAAMLMAAVQHPPGRSLPALILFTMLGGILATGGAHAINQYCDRDIDARMRRTKRRAVVTGRIPARHALIFGIILSLLSLVLLWLAVNPVAALLAIAGNLFYVFVYTIWLKRTSVQNIVIGGAAGAVPPLVGWAAVTGGVDISALLLFAIIFFWTPAHFWALALVRQEDYRAAGIPMLPVVRGEKYTRRSILLYAVLLLLVSLLPVVLHTLSWIYLAAALGLGLVFVLRAAQLVGKSSTARAWNLFKFSNIYLALLYAAMVLDRVLALGGNHPL